MNKNKIINMLGIIFLIVSIVGYCYLEKIYFNDFVFDRTIIFFCVIIFGFLHFILDINKMYEFIYKKRYYIGSILLIYIIIMGYHGSSVGMYNRFVQTNNIPTNSNPILGVLRGIRSDEWMVNTPFYLSQIFTKFSKYNNLFMANNSLIMLYPSLPCLSISLLGKLFFIPFIIFPFENAFSFYWFGKLFLLFFTTFELFMILTKKNKLYSLLGAVLVSFGPANMWWYLIEAILWGNTATLIFYYIIKCKKVFNKVILSIFLGITGLNYVLILYPAWQVAFGYLYLGLFIYILLENKKDLNYKLLLYLLIILPIIIGPLYLIISGSIDIMNLTSGTVYPGSRLILGGYGHELLHNYILNIFYTFKDVGNPSEYSNFIGFYPIPIILSIYYIIKNKLNNKKTDKFLLILTIVALFISLWNYIELPKWFIKMTLLSYSTPFRAQIVINYICIFLLVYLLSKYQKDKKVKLKDLLLPMILSFLVYFLSLYFLKNTMEFYLTKKVILSSFIIFIPLFIFIFLNYKKYNKYFAIIVIFISLFAGGTVNPISKGVTVIKNKPLSKAIQNIAETERDSRWMTINSDLTIANFALANGAKIINSTNFYPNFSLWYKLDPDKKYEKIYNRYAHVVFEVSNQKTSFELLQEDYFQVNILIDDICKLNVQYAISKKDLYAYNNNAISFEKIYSEDGIQINKVSCR